MKQGLSDVLLFVIHVLEYFSTVPPIPTYEAGISDVLLFVITCVRVFSTVLPIPPMKQGLSDAALVMSFLCVHVLEYFSTVPTHNSHSLVGLVMLPL
jgi:hypothetical protein